MNTEKSVNEEKGNAVLPLVSGSESKECKNCLYFNVVKTECKHPNWDKCIKRDNDEYVIDYVYHEYHYR
jgi:hypothetical protein